MRLHDFIVKQDYMLVVINILSIPINDKKGVDAPILEMDEIKKMVSIFKVVASSPLWRYSISHLVA